MEGMKELIEKITARFIDLFPGATNALMGGLKDVGKVYGNLATAASVAEIIRLIVAIVVAESMINRFLSRRTKPTISDAVFGGLDTGMATIREMTEPALTWAKGSAYNLADSAKSGVVNLAESATESVAFAKDWAFGKTNKV